MVSQAVAGIGSLIYIMRHYPELRWSREEGCFSLTHCAKLCSMGIPMGCLLYTSVVEEGPAKQLIEHPQEERTKQFLSHYGG